MRPNEVKSLWAKKSGWPLQIKADVYAFRQSCEKSFSTNLVDGSQRRSKLKIRLGIAVAPSRWPERWDGPDQSRMVPTGRFPGRETPHNGAPGSRGNPWPDLTCECVLIHVILACYLYHCFTMDSNRQHNWSKGIWSLGTRIYIDVFVRCQMSLTVGFKEREKIIHYSLLL